MKPEGVDVRDVEEASTTAGDPGPNQKQDLEQDDVEGGEGYRTCCRCGFPADVREDLTTPWENTYNSTVTQRRETVSTYYNCDWRGKLHDF